MERKFAALSPNWAKFALLDEAGSNSWFVAVVRRLRRHASARHSEPHAGASRDNPQRFGCRPVLCSPGHACVAERAQCARADTAAIEAQSAALGSGRCDRVG